MKLASEFTIRDDFPPVSYAEWRALAEADLQGVPFEKKLVTHTYEGINIQPVYTRQDFAGDEDLQGFPGRRPFVRGAQPLGQLLGGADLRQQYAHPNAVVTNQAILADLAGGVTSLELRFDALARQGFDPDDANASNPAKDDGVMIYSVDELDSALAEVDLSTVGVAVVAGAAFLPVAAMLAALWKRRGKALDDVNGAFNADPLSDLAREGCSPVPAKAALVQLADLAVWTHASCPRVTAVGVETSPYHHAGATAAQDLAVAMATGVAYLRAMTEGGLSVDAAARQILFRVSLGTHHFLAIAKLRAARRLWGRVVEVSGGSEDAGAMRIQARASDRVLTQRDPYVNILRNTVCVFAACIGGADVITSVPLDQVTGPPDDFTRRVARNTLLVLQEEAHLHRVIDPAGGSWFLDRITNELAAEAWCIFQEIERRGGMFAVLESGWIGGEINLAFAPRAKDIARRKEGITGVSEFPNVADERIARQLLDVAALRKAAAERLRRERPSSEAVGELSSGTSRTTAVVEMATRGATIGQLARSLGFHKSPTKIERLKARSFAEPFEELRDAADAWQAANGRRPRVFLANMGPVAQHTARAAYAKSFFEAGGLETVTNDGFDEVDAAADAFAKSGASIAAICSSDRLYPEMVPTLAAKLKSAGARSVVLAGNPGDNESTWRDAGVDRFIFIKCDVLATLRELLREEGVLLS
jgi:methylmalonyl-CoA mutase